MTASEQLKESLRALEAWSESVNGDRRTPENVVREMQSTSQQVGFYLREIFDKIVHLVGQVVYASVSGAAKETAGRIQILASELGDYLIEVTDAQEAHPPEASRFQAWQAVVARVGEYASFHADLLAGVQERYPGVEDYALGYAVGSLDTLSGIAREQRLRGIRMSMNGPLSEYALADAATLGLVEQEPFPEEAGIVRSQTAEGIILERSSGQFVVCPISSLPEGSVGKPVSLKMENGRFQLQEEGETGFLEEEDQEKELPVRRGPETEMLNQD
ncbi:hypothetical protein AB4090_05295 [Acidithiobacillus sp. IBUN Pt1247-S3]|uniref:hypothetical protein n=1 Tax=Acidithiobacillus sp. IBUN Pt1247-S3 TaxID=3166642 RepID=UPI0034E604D1